MFTADYFPYIYLYNPRVINKDTTTHRRAHELNYWLSHSAVTDTVRYPRTEGQMRPSVGPGLDARLWLTN